MFDGSDPPTRKIMPDRRRTRITVPPDQAKSTRQRDATPRVRAHAAAGSSATSEAPLASGDADEKPDDLMYLSVVKQSYCVSQTTLDRHIKAKKLKAWCEKDETKRKVSKAAVELLYDAR